MSLQGWWPCDDVAADKVVLDYSGNGRNGESVQNTSAITDIGKTGRCLTFGGASDKIDAAAGSVWDFGAAFTLCAWIKLNGTPVAYSTIFSHEATNGYSLLCHSDKKIHLWTSASANWTHVESASAVTDGVWTHVAAVLSGGTGTIYLNGAANGTPGSLPTPGAQALQPFRIGQISHGTASRWFKGAMDDARVWNEALAAWQVTALWNGGMGSSRPYPWQPRIVRETIRPTLLRGAA